MPVRNPNWYNLQSTRRYPMDDNANGTGDDGTRIADDVLVDCHLRWPLTAGQYAYIGGITVTDTLVSVVILAADSPDATSGFVPLASVSLLKPVERHVHYSVEPMYPGVGGFLVFGDLFENFSARFSTPAQSLLLPKCARPYESLPIPTLRKLGRDIGLMGLVKILPGSDVEIVKETHEVDGNDRDVLVIRLLQSIPNRNVLEVYRGPCDDRPESHTCNKDGIEQINDVKPDCAGNINITFVSMTPGPYESCGPGVTLDQELGITEVCEEFEPGRFPGVDQCDPSSSAGSEAPTSETSEPETPEESEESEGSSPVDPVSSESCAPLPYEDDFEDTTADGFEVYLGTYSFHDISGDVYYAADGTSRRNVSLLEHCAIESTLEKRVTTDAVIAQSGSKENAMLILNHHLADPFTNPHEEYFALTIDKKISRVQLLRFNGVTFIEENGVTTGSPLIYGHKYKLEAEITASTGSNVAIDVTVSGVTNPSWPAITFSILTTKYLPATGKFGVGSNRSVARFSNFLVEDL